MYSGKNVPPKGILRAGDLYQCSESDILCLQEKLERVRHGVMERTPYLLSLLESFCFRQSLQDASRTVSGWPEWRRSVLGSLSQPKCTIEER